MDTGLHLTIVSPERKLFDGDVLSVTLPGQLGSFTILPRHAPIVSVLQRGKLIWLTNNSEPQTLDINDGFVELSNGVVSACVTII